MSTKIAASDNKAMNALLGLELKAAGLKVAAAGEEGSGDPQAFEDHEEYLKTLDEVLKEGDKESWSPNDEILD